MLPRVLVATAVLLALVGVAVAKIVPFDVDEANYAIRWNKVVACDASVIADWTCKACKHLHNVSNVSVFHNKSHGSQAYVAYHTSRRNIIVSFRGSVNTINWIEDFNLWFKVYPLCSNVTGTPNPMPPRNGPPSTGMMRPLNNEASARREMNSQSTGASANGATTDTEVKNVLRIKKALSSTDEKKPLDSNLGDSWEEKGNYCYVHDGFWTTWQDLSFGVSNAVDSLLQMDPGAEVIVVGWSLGAAVATHAAVELTYYLPKTRQITNADGSTSYVSPVKAIYNMGSPRMGTPVFVKWATELFEANNVTMRRMVHSHDLVPKVPTLEMGYIHMPHEVWFPYGNSSLQLPESRVYKVCDDDVGHEDPTCSDSVILQNGVADNHMQMDGEYLGCN